MIYVSTACVRAETICKSIQVLAEEGFLNLELSGGTSYYDGYKRDLLHLQDKYSLHYLVHNYFPPPKEGFVLNLASLNDDLYEMSFQHCKRAIWLCKMLGSKKYAVHAGFLIDFLPAEAGKKISYRSMNDRHRALQRFCNAWKLLVEYAGESLTLYIENNVLSKTNAMTYRGDNPFLLTGVAGYNEIKDQLDFNLLLDFAHLKVSCTSLELDFQNQAKTLLSLTDYYHVSGNDGLHDQNLGVESDPDIKAVLATSDLSGKTMTLEVYNGIGSLHKSFDYLLKIVAD